MYVYTCTYTCKLIHVLTHARLYMHIYKHINTCTYTRVCLYMCINMYVYCLQNNDVSTVINTNYKYMFIIVPMINRYIKKLIMLS